MKIERHPYSRTLCRVMTAKGYRYFNSAQQAAEWVVRYERFADISIEWGNLPYWTRTKS